ncbi:hypothetical protein, partial [Enterobacter hormaechei]|uniref:hypothetical protein n=1 Tax=Enterobacter hormaechei TaxID=158836 RepID=UPI001ED99BAB
MMGGAREKGGKEGMRDAGRAASTRMTKARGIAKRDDNVGTGRGKVRKGKRREDTRGRGRGRG